MTIWLKTVFLLLAGLCWQATGVFVLIFAFRYLGNGAGAQLFPFFSVSSTSVMVGLVHFLGFMAAAFLSFVIGVALCARACVPAQKGCSRNNPQG